MDRLELLRSEDLRSRGFSAARISTAPKSGLLVRVRPGVYCDGAGWRQAKTEERIRTRAHALQLVARRRPVYANETAAAAHRLPLYRAAADRVHVALGPDRPGAPVGVTRHRDHRGVTDVMEVEGLLCTTLERTCADIARTGTFEQAVTVLDAALRRLCVPRPGEYDVGRSREFKSAVLAIAADDAFGFARAERAVRFADGRAQLPGESVSRILLDRIGFREIRLQVHVPGPDRTDYFVDFGLEEVRSFGEFDGSMKYVDGRLVDGRTTAEIFDREKRREDWIRGRTQRRYARWGWPHLASADTLAGRLEAFGIRPLS